MSTLDKVRLEIPSPCRFARGFGRPLATASPTRLAEVKCQPFPRSPAAEEAAGAGQGKQTGHGSLKWTPYTSVFDVTHISQKERPLGGKLLLHTKGELPTNLPKGVHDHHCQPKVEGGLTKAHI